MNKIEYNQKDLLGKKETPLNIICTESISFQVKGTGNIIVESSIDNGETWHQNSQIVNVVAPCYVEVINCIIGTGIRLKTDGEFNQVILNI